MPLNVEYLQDNGDNKKGSRRVMPLREFMSLRKAGIVKRASILPAMPEKTEHKATVQKKPSIKK